MKKFAAPSLALVSAAVVFVAACSPNSDGPLSPMSRAVTADQGTFSAATVQVCVDPSSTPASYTFTPSATANTVADDQTTNPLVINTALPGPTCGNIMVRNPVGGNGQVATVTVSGATAATGTWSYTCIEEGGMGACSAAAAAGNVATAGESSFHGSTITFKFVADVVHEGGCTYTQGWWKNKGKAASQALTVDGLNAYTVLTTPPKGNAYYIIMDQYIAATLNVNNGASLTGTALTAYNWTTTYLTFASVANPTPAGYTKAAITGNSTILDNYNNGLIGPGHCGEEVL